MDHPSFYVAGIEVKATSPSEATNFVVKSALSDSSSAVHFINAYTISLAATDVNLKQILNSATANYPDGKPLSWIGRLRGINANQVRGPETFENVLDQGRVKGLRHFLLGGSPDTLASLATAITEKYEGVHIVGTYSPPFRKLSQAELDEQDELIRDSGANIVWVGLGTPKQDYETARLARSVPITAAAVGAAFDFTAGTKQMAPAWISKAGFEWLYRFITEPRRLWKRYTIGNAKFLYFAARNWNSDEKP
ncbi:WecB/TagA/CpsF family glycosyltransferase [Kocuria flava]|uniref:UDP-N-acetyl-D-mannosaminuronic acid transferase n=1 Tax=Kocuria flava TaxID=446860 RepID=A0ABQ0XB56_9MICC|nr:WecB/TagA/CpsF family glycosyltransferase [Kocuria flava]GEO92020.1 UDP-N-acetyl-D-mannosaminuronic acid transferase [Kocuria flava]